MTERRVLLDAAAFLDASEFEVDGVSRDEVRTIVQRLLRSCYLDVGKAPRLMDDEDLGAVMAEHLPRRFGARDPLAPKCAEVLPRFFEHLLGHQVVPYAFELRSGLPGGIDAFLAAVESGRAHADGLPFDGPTTVVHRAEKTGRNDPCPCGSGRKFKKCCMQLGRG